VESNTIIERSLDFLSNLIWDPAAGLRIRIQILTFLIAYLANRFYKWGETQETVVRSRQVASRAVSGKGSRSDRF